MSIGENIKRVRTQRGLTQKELSYLVKISENMLKQYENNLRNPKQDRLNAIANALGVNPEVLTAPKNIPGEDMHALFRVFRNHEGKFSENGDLIFRDNISDEIFLWFQQWKICEETIKKAENISDEVERSYIIENAKDRFNYWMDTYPHSSAINRNFDEELEAYQKVKQKKREQQK